MFGMLFDLFVIFGVYFTGYVGTYLLLTWLVQRVSGSFIPDNLKEAIERCSTWWPIFMCVFLPVLAMTWIFPSFGNWIAGLEKKHEWIRRDDIPAPVPMSEMTDEEFEEEFKDKF